ncbi:hypothetical protein G7046_g4094 [Stylonectria norvegica]|nr:hypothetical protein G7046_g4094 [Stylonectria norvegica]
MTSTIISMITAMQQTITSPRTPHKKGLLGGFGAFVATGTSMIFADIHSVRPAPLPPVGLGIFGTVRYCLFHRRTWVLFQSLCISNVLRNAIVALEARDWMEMVPTGTGFVATPLLYWLYAAGLMRYEKRDRDRPTSKTRKVMIKRMSEIRLYQGDRKISDHDEVRKREDGTEHRQAEKTGIQPLKGEIPCMYHRMSLSRRLMRHYIQSVVGIECYDL